MCCYRIGSLGVVFKIYDDSTPVIIWVSPGVCTINIEGALLIITEFFKLKALTL